MVIAHHGGAPEQAEVGLAFKIRGNRAVVDQQHPGTGPGGGPGGGPAAGAGAHDGHVGVGMAVLIALGIGCLGHPAEAGGLADEGLDQVPGALADKGLVIKPGRHEGFEQADHGAGVEAQRGPAVLALGHQTGLEFDPRGLRVGLGQLPAAQAHQGVGLLGPGRHDAARPVVLETAPDQPHTGAEQRRGQSIAGKTRVGPAVETETQRLAAVDGAKFGMAPGAAHEAASASRSRIRLLAVSRPTTIQRRQPWAWYQRSRCAPLGLSRR